MYRSLVVGLLGAVIYLLAEGQQQPPAAPAVAMPTPAQQRCDELLMTNQVAGSGCPGDPEATERPAQQHVALRVVDVVASLSGGTLHDLVALERGEYITEIDDLVMANAAEATTMLELRSRERGYLDITVDNGFRERRVILLVH